MKLLVAKSGLGGRVTIPGSKSHTIRGVIFGTLARGSSKLICPLKSEDTLSAVRCCRALGADIELKNDFWEIEGLGDRRPLGDGELDVGNSGTTLGNLLAVCALGEAKITLDGDSSIRSRPFGPLLQSIRDLGAVKVESENSDGKAPIAVQGPLAGGETVVDGSTSLYLTPLLVAGPKAKTETHIIVEGKLKEKGYVQMTMDWLDIVGASYNKKDLSEFQIPPGQSFGSFVEYIPGDFSSAAFPITAASVSGDSEVEITGLDFSDSQGDKVLVDFLKRMGADLEITSEGLIVHPGAKLKGGSFDLSNSPDLLPVMAVLGCISEGKTELTNVASARIKETDRISAMRKELENMGAKIEEQPDGLTLESADLRGASLDGHKDHRIVMALVVAGMAASGETLIRGSESIKVTYPSFVESMKSLGGNIKSVE